MATLPRRLLLVLALVAGVGFPLALVLHARGPTGGAPGFPLDDAWIHLTYARNLAQHGSLAYSPGEPASAGSTSPLYTLLLAGGLLFTDSEKVLGHTLGLVIHLLFLGALAAWGLRRLGSLPWTAALVLLLGLDSRVGILAVSGMETSLFLFWLALAFYARLSRRPWLLAAALGLSIWTRPEGIILAAVLAIEAAIRRFWSGRAEAPDPPAEDRTGGGVPVGPLLLFGALAGGYLLLNYLLGGGPLPNTFAAKTAYYAVNTRWAFVTGDLSRLVLTGGWVLVLPLFALGGLWASAALVRRRHVEGPLPELGWALALPLAYLIFLPFSHRFERYLVPALPCLLLVGLVTLRRLSAMVAGAASPRLTRALLATVVLAMVGLQGANAAEAFGSHAQFCQYMVARHERTGRWLAKNTPPDAVVATHDIGAVAFYSGRRVVDIVGIVTPETVQHLGTGVGYRKYLRRLFARQGVTHLVTLANWLEVDNVPPLFVADPKPEVMMVFAWAPKRVHLVDPVVTAMRGETLDLLRSGQVGRGMKLLVRMVERDPGSALSWLILGKGFEISGQPGQARKAYRRSLALYPGSRDAARSLARLGGGSGP